LLSKAPQLIQLKPQVKAMKIQLSEKNHGVTVSITLQVLPEIFEHQLEDSTAASVTEYDADEFLQEVIDAVVPQVMTQLHQVTQTLYLSFLNKHSDFLQKQHDYRRSLE
jgi:hypothetical protein